MYDVTYLDGPYIAHVSGQLSLIERETYPDAICSMGTGRTDCDCCEHPREVETVVVETDGGAFFIPARRVIAWRES